MKKINIIKENREYNRIIQTIKPYKYKDYIIYIEKNQKHNTYKFGFSIGKKIGCAVIRNKIKRQLKNILDEKDYQKGVNCIIIVRKSILNKTFEEMKINLLKALTQVDIIKKEKLNEENEKYI